MGLKQFMQYSYLVHCNFPTLVQCMWCVLAVAEVFRKLHLNLMRQLQCYMEKFLSKDKEMERRILAPTYLQIREIPRISKKCQVIKKCCRKTRECESFRTFHSVIFIEMVAQFSDFKEEIALFNDFSTSVRLFFSVLIN